MLQCLVDKVVFIFSPTISITSAISVSRSDVSSLQTVSDWTVEPRQGIRCLGFQVFYDRWDTLLVIRETYSTFIVRTGFRHFDTLTVDQLLFRATFKYHSLGKMWQVARESINHWDT